MPVNFNSGMPPQKDISKEKDLSFYDKILEPLDAAVHNVQAGAYLHNKQYKIKGLGIDDLEIIRTFLSQREDTVFKKDSILQNFYNKAVRSGKPIDTVMDPYYGKASFTYGRDYRYIDYEMMDSYTPEISSALDMYADYIIQEDPRTNKYFEIVEETEGQHPVADQVYKKITKEQGLLFESLGLNKGEFLHSLVRTAVKYGDAYLLYDFLKDKSGEIIGINNIQSLHPQCVKVICHPVTKQVVCYEYMPFRTYNPIANNSVTISQGSPAGMQMIDTFKHDDAYSQLRHIYTPVEVLHIKLNEDKFSPYGTSILEAIRRTWKQWIMLEDMMTVFRINKTIDRRTYEIEVGDLPRDEALEYLREVEIFLSKQPSIDLDGLAQDGKDWIAKAHSFNEVLYIPTRGGQGVKPGVMAGMSDNGFENDLNYLQSKIFSKLKIPKSYLTYDKDVNAKATLIEESKAFAKTVFRYQNVFAEHLWTIFQLDKWFKKELGEIVGFKLLLRGYESVLEKEMIASLSDKTRIAESLLGLTYKIIKKDGKEEEIKLIAPEFILRKVLNMPEEYVTGILEKINRENIDIKEEGKEEEDNQEEGDNDEMRDGNFENNAPMMDLGLSDEGGSEEEMMDLGLDEETPPEERMPESLQIKKRKKDIKKLLKRLEKRKKE